MCLLHRAGQRNEPDQFAGNTDDALQYQVRLARAGRDMRHVLSYAGDSPATNLPMTAERGDPARHSELRRALGASHREAFAWALNCCRRNRGEAEDVLQATYLKVLDGSAQFDGRSTFRTWLFGVIRLTAAQQRRRQWLSQLGAARVVAEESTSELAPAADSALALAQRRAILDRALRLLPVRQREVLLLVFYHELTVEDAAQVMSIGVGSARQHYARGKARLRDMLARTGVAP